MLEPGESDLFPFIACNFIAFWKFYFYQFKGFFYLLIIIIVYVSIYKILLIDRSEQNM